MTSLTSTNLRAIASSALPNESYLRYIILITTRISLVSLELTPSPSYSPLASHFPGQRHPEQPPRQSIHLLDRQPDPVASGARRAATQRPSTTFPSGTASTPAGGRARPSSFPDEQVGRWAKRGPRAGPRVPCSRGDPVGTARGGAAARAGKVWCILCRDTCKPALR